MKILSSFGLHDKIKRRKDYFIISEKQKGRKMGLGDFVQGAMGNMNQKNVGNLEQEFGLYLFDGEQIKTGFALVRDSIIFTNYRIIFVDKQGATGKKIALKSIYLMNLVDVEMETAGRGIDDSEITITYLTNIKRKAHREEFASKTFEFPKSMDIAPLYRMLGNMVMQNRREINQGQ